jgi:hypothetical protein
MLRMDVGFLISVVLVVVRIGGRLPRWDAAGRPIDVSLVAAGVALVAFGLHTMVAVRRLPGTDSAIARRSLWALGTSGMILAALLIRP